MPQDRTAGRAHGLRRHALASAISAAVAGGDAEPVLAQSTPAGLEEIIVTARKRDENLQDVPQAILAFRTEDLERHGIRSLQDLARFVPALTVVGTTSGAQKIVFRGLADSATPYLVDSSAAIYLDEQPLTSGSATPGIRPIDLERIESLAGPQGTLYGASSQSGTVRYIVAKPDPAAFAASIGAGSHAIDEGGTGWDTDAMLNLPLLEGRLALRLVGFAAKDAGFIDNVLGSRPYAGTATNANLVEKDINETDWRGGRVSAKWLFAEGWSLTGIYNISDSSVHGPADYDPTLGDLKTVLFHDNSSDDEWSNYQLTLNGDLGFAQLSSSTAYFGRETAYESDGTSDIAYYHAAFGAWGRGNCASAPGMAEYNVFDLATACELNGLGTDVDDADPTGFFSFGARDQRWTHETRLAGSSSRLDWTFGFFYQKAETHGEYGVHIPGLVRTESWAAFEALNGELADTEVTFAVDGGDEREDYALFGEASVNLGAHWRLLLGARAYRTDLRRVDTARLPATAPPDTIRVGGDEEGVLPKIGAQYVFDDDAMLYALYSEGFRLGGVNLDKAQRLGLQSTFPPQYDPDILENWEAGIRARSFGARLQTNLTAYHQVWSEMQLQVSDPQVNDLVDSDGDGVGDTRYPYQDVIANLGDAVVDGFDLDFALAFDSGVRLGLVSTCLFRAELDEELRVTNPNDPGLVTLYLPQGTRLPLAADFSLAAWAEYTRPLSMAGGGDAWLRLQYSYTGGSWNRLYDNDGSSERTGRGGRVHHPDYELWDLRGGYTGTRWEFSLYLDNLLDQRVVNYHPTWAERAWGWDSILTEHPRTAGFSVRRHLR